MTTLRPLGMTLAILSILVLAAPAANARKRHELPKSGSVHREVTRTGPDGQPLTSTADTTFQRGDGKWTRDTVRTGPKGGQTTTHVDGAKTADGFVRDKTTTGPNGKTATTHDELHRSDGGYSRVTTRTGPAGGVATRESQGVWDSATKTWKRTTTLTGPKGNSKTTEKSTTFTPGGGAPAAQ
jgi:hypothetical protein